MPIPDLLGMTRLAKPSEEGHRSLESDLISAFSEFGMPSSPPCWQR
jgi:hypothetical protein